MQFSCPNPGCGAVYNVATNRVGMRVNCKKCGAALIMGEHGLEMADANVEERLAALGKEDEIEKLLGELKARRSQS